jgi:hypothetical protein
MNSATREDIAARALAIADGEGSTPMTRGGGSVPEVRSRISLVTAPGPHPRSTITWRPGQITFSTIQRLTCVKKGCRVNGVNENLSLSANDAPLTVCESRAARGARRGCG